MHPATLLAFLTSLAAVGGSICWNAFKDTQRLSAAGDPSNLQRAADGSIMQPLPELSAGTVGDGPTGTLQKQVQRLEDQNQLLQKENQDLRQRLARELEAKTPPPTPAELAEQLAKLRKLEFKTPVTFATKPLDEIQSAVGAEVASRISPEAGTARGKAYQAMGFVPDTFDYRQAMQETLGSQLISIYDSKTNNSTFQNDAELRRIDGRDVAISAAHRALQAQYFAGANPLPVESANDDADCALRALAIGETSYYRVSWTLQDSLVNLMDQGSPPTMASPGSAPLFFTEQYKFCADQGKSFVETLLMRGNEPFLNNAYQRPPASTAEILHPDLYLANPPFQAAKIELPEVSINGAGPYFKNVAGEFSIYLMFRQFVSADLALRVSDGWAGDAYATFSGPPQYGDHVLWKTSWRTPEDGQEFFDGMKRILMQRLTIPYQKEYDQERAFVVNDPHRQLRLRQSPDKLSVTLVNTTEAAAADALDK